MVGRGCEMVAQHVESCACNAFACAERLPHADPAVGRPTETEKDQAHSGRPGMLLFAMPGQLVQHSMFVCSLPPGQL